ncbi:ATP-binding cassette domain-containing protein [Intestinibaculum porci]|uniref:ATP-binding cassette domain-containing protein n=1 Tax=Intestinibaculum porci TaxID=2487118 RepID=UPI002409E9B7|nr:ATP-binding cassette domain-containing protein [Intestinibaculum porci]MDD6350705.1 ATP-binding cassette domain-containing protein [Intestinibaculum porci]MDD6422327.1 ATP-binding cassette domain-containing protein [Intestinibaculum porci]
MRIEVKNVSKTIKKNVILKNVNMHFESGHIYGFVGSNGSGKTVMMRILCGLIDVTNGTIMVDGKTMHFGKDLYYPMGVIIEKPEFFDEQTGMNNLRTLAQIRKVIGDQEIADSMRIVGLDPQNNKRVKAYSLGMRQRLGLAQAIMEDPAVLILDEVTSALDDEGVKMCREVLLKEKEKGKLIIISSHNKADIEALCDELYLFKNQEVTRL